MTTLTKNTEKVFIIETGDSPCYIAWKTARDSKADNFQDLIEEIYFTLNTSEGNTRQHWVDRSDRNYKLAFEAAKRELCK